MPTISIGADGIDAKKLEEEILQAVAEKRKSLVGFLLQIAEADDVSEGFDGIQYAVGA